MGGLEQRKGRLDGRPLHGVDNHAGAAYHNSNEDA